MSVEAEEEGRGTEAGRLMDQYPGQAGINNLTHEVIISWICHDVNKIVQGRGGLIGIRFGFCCLVLSFVRVVGFLLSAFLLV